MADAQRQVPGGVYFVDVQEASLAQRQVPAESFVNDAQQSQAAAATNPLPRMICLLP